MAFLPSLPSGGRGTPSVPAPLLQWLPWHEIALRLHLEGKNYVAISAVVGYPPPVVKDLLDHPDFLLKARDYRLRDEVEYWQNRERAWKLTPKALKLMDSVITEFSRLQKGDEAAVERQALKGYGKAREAAMAAGKELLEQVGLKKPDKLEVDSKSEHTETRVNLSYEQRLNLVKEHKGAGVPVPDEVNIVDLGEDEVG